jgi:hypothetical protein
MRRHGKPILLAICAALLLLPAQAYSAGYYVLDYLDVDYRKNSSVLNINFLVPVNYIQHYPSSQGTSINIKLRPIAHSLTDKNNFLNSEVIRWKTSRLMPLISARYDGSLASGPELVLRFRRHVKFTIKQTHNPRTLAIVIHHAASRNKAATTKLLHATNTTLPPASPVLTAIKPDINAYRFTINLVSSSRRRWTRVPKNIPAINNYLRYLYIDKVKGRTVYHRRAGFFYKKSNANRVLDKIRTRFKSARVVTLSRYEKRHVKKWLSDVLRHHKPPYPIAIYFKRKPIPGTPVNFFRPISMRRLIRLMESARRAIAMGKYPTAIRLYSKVLRYESHPYNKDALEYLGLARERNKQIAHAKAEYRRYLHLYPKSSGAVRVRQRLAVILTARKRAPGRRSLARKSPPKSRWTIFGNIFQFARRDTLSVKNQDNTTTTTNISTNINIIARKKTKTHKFKTRVSLSHTYNLEGASGTTPFRFNTLLFESKNLKTHFLYRIGRQSNSRGGVLGRFDGVYASYRIRPKLKLNIVTGLPVEFSSTNSIQTDTYFYGINVDIGTLAKYWQLNLFAINQESFDLVDRQAIGTEIRYLKPGRSLFLLLDYDVSYESLNTLLFIGNWRFKNKVSVNLTVDYRNSPILTTNSALQGQSVTSIEELKLTLTEDQIRKLAQDRTARFWSTTLSTSVPLSKKYLFNAELSVSNLSSTVTSGGVDAVPGTDNEYYYTLQLVGSNIFKQGDTSIFGIRYSDTSTSDRLMFSLNTRYPVNSFWRVNPRFRIEKQRRNDGSNVLIARPSIRVDYRPKRRLKFEFEAGYEESQYTKSINDRIENNIFFNLGYIYTF